MNLPQMNFSASINNETIILDTTLKNNEVYKDYLDKVIYRNRDRMKLLNSIDFRKFFRRDTIY